MKRLAQFVNLLLGMVSGGLLFSYAGAGAISWWMVVLVFAWVISTAVFCVAELWGLVPLTDTHHLQIDLSGHEMLRRTHMFTAMPDFDFSHAFAVEEHAHELLYSGLDDEQQRVYDELVEAGVLDK